MNRLSSAMRRAFSALHRSDPLDEQQVARVLVIGSAPAANIARAVDALLVRFAAAHITVLVPAPSERSLRLRHERVTVVGDATALSLRRMAGHDAAYDVQYDVKVALFTGEGHNALKLAAFLAPAPHLLIFTEGGGMFYWSINDRLAVWNHLRWRLSGGGPLPALLGRLARALADPIIAGAAFVRLLAWHGRMWLIRRRGTR